MRRFFLFSREKRVSIPASIIDAIKALNAEDIALYEQAKHLLQEQRAKHVGGDHLLLHHTGASIDERVSLNCL